MCIPLGCCMDLKDQITAIATRAVQQEAHLETEEATKTALIMPFIMALGYDVFNLVEVVPEFTADVGVKKGEKVDYAIMRDGKPIIIFECKKYNENLEACHKSQLFRYFTVTPARFAILTNGIKYKFYTDLEQQNKLDERSFLELDICNFKDSDIIELKRFSKESFNEEEILSTASELKYMREIQRTIDEQFSNPSDELTKLFSTSIYSGRWSQAAKEQFSSLIKRAFQQYINTEINKRLKAVMDKSENAEIIKNNEPLEEVSAEQESIVTTQEEIEAFYIVRAILRKYIDANRVYIRDSKSYCAILLDNNNRRPICRLHFNNINRKMIGIFDETKNETKHNIDNLTEIYSFTEALAGTVARYMEQPEAVEPACEA
jgi:predicted type IV restriction endonuclease